VGNIESMQKNIGLCGTILAIVIIAYGNIGISFAQISSMNGSTILPTNTTTESATTNQLQSSSNSTTDQTKVITHSLGTTQITGVPQRIVVMGPEFVEHLLTLGVQPAGIVDSSTFKLWYPSMVEQLSVDVVNLGDYPPNLEVLAKLQPDLIIAGTDLYGELYQDLTSIAPTIIFDLFPDQGDNATQLEKMEEVHLAIADIVDRRDQGVANIDHLHSKFVEAASKLKGAGLAGHKFIFVEAGVWEDAPWMNIYSRNAELSIILEQIGLQNAIGNTSAAQSDSYGFISSSLEGLSALDGSGVHMFYTTALGGDVFGNSTYWSENPVWTNLQFVREGHVYNLDKVYAFAGPSQAELLVDKVIQALTNDNN
jgi:ferric hydroxamate transport system substrate-binding protein